MSQEEEQEGDDLNDASLDSLRRKVYRLGLRVPPHAGRQGRYSFSEIGVSPPLPCIVRFQSLGWSGSQMLCPHRVTGGNFTSQHVALNVFRGRNERLLRPHTMSCLPPKRPRNQFDKLLVVRKTYVLAWHGSEPWCGTML